MTPPIDLLVRNVRIVTCTDTECGVTPPAFVAVVDGRIGGLGPMSALDPNAPVRAELDGEGALLTPGLIDCHTHLVHAGHGSTPLGPQGALGREELAETPCRPRRHGARAAAGHAAGSTSGRTPSRRI